LIFLRVPLLVKLIFPERTYIAICLILIFTVDVLEGVKTVFSFLHLKSWEVSLEVHLAIPCHVSMVFNLVRTITFDVFNTICMAYKDSMALFPAVFALGNARVHICFINSYNVAFYVKAPINKVFSLRATLSILYIDPDNYHIELGGYFDYSRLRYENDIIEDVWRLNDFFNHISYNRSGRIFGKVRNTQNLKV